MNTKYSLLAAAIAGALVGCGSDDSDTPPVTETFTITGHVIDSEYVANTSVCLDFNSFADSCVSGYQVETDDQGQFTFEVDVAHKGDLDTAKFTASVPQDSSAYAASEAEQIEYLSLLAGADDGEYVVTPYTTQLFDHVRRTATGAINSATLNTAKQEIVVSHNASNSTDMFSDYSSNIELTQKAQLMKVDMQKAREILLEIEDDPQYQDWDVLHVIVSDLWQHSPHNHEFTNRIEHLIYMANYDDQGAKINDRIEGVQWYKEEYEHGNMLPLQNFEENRTWVSANLVDVYTFFEFDYDQDGEFKFKGEKAARYKYAVNEFSYDTFVGYEVYNEGNPSEEGADHRPDRIWVDGCPVETEIDKVETEEVLNSCIDFVELRDMSTINLASDVQYNDFMTEWQSGCNYDDEESDCVSEIIVGKDNQDYYEERTQDWFANGSQQYTIRSDWHAAHYHNPDLPHEQPFNVVKTDGVDSTGNETLNLSSPYWADSIDTQYEVPLKGIRQYSQINPFNWRNLESNYVVESFERSINGDEFYSSETLYLDPDLEMQYVDELGQSVSWGTSEVRWDEEQQSLKAKLVTKPINEPYSTDSYQEEYEIEYLTQMQGLDVASMTVNSENRYAITPSFFDSEKKWQVKVVEDSLKGDIERIESLIDLIFMRNESYSFSESESLIGAHSTHVCFNGDDPERLELESVNTLMTFDKGGDAYFNIRCNEHDNGNVWNWTDETLKLEIIDQDSSGNFTALIKGWWWGESIIEDEVAFSAEVTFTRK